MIIDAFTFRYWFWIIESICWSRWMDLYAASKNKALKYLYSSKSINTSDSVSLTWKTLKIWMKHSSLENRIFHCQHATVWYMHHLAGWTVAMCVQYGTSSDLLYGHLFSGMVWVMVQCSQKTWLRGTWQLVKKRQQQLDLMISMRRQGRWCNFKAA